MLTSRLYVPVALWIAAANPAFAEFISRCGASSGYAHYPESELVSKAQAGWRKDGITNGALQLVRNGDQFDVLYTDAAGTRSARSDGFHISRVKGTAAGRYLLVGVNAVSGVVEHWLFIVDGSGRGTVVWGSIRGGVTLPKSSLMEARCDGR